MYLKVVGDAQFLAEGPRGPWIPRLPQECPARLHFRKDAEGPHERRDQTPRTSPRFRQGRSLPGQR
jgi:hypothetical protein